MGPYPQAASARCCSRRWLEATGCLNGRLSGKGILAAVTSLSQTPIDVDRVLNEGRWTGYQRWLVFLTALTIIFDGFDNQLLGVALPTIMREWSVTRGAFAPVVSL